jgi:acyl carrier protein
MTTDSMPAELLRSIERFINEVRASKQLPPIAVSPGTSLVDGSAGIDSLDLAALVVELQTITDKDPFADGFRNFEHAGTLAELFR